MAKPYERNHRSDILNAFNSTAVATVSDIVTIINSSPEVTSESVSPTSYQSTRRMMLKMVKEGTVTELPKRGEKNQRYYTKTFFKDTTRLINYEGDNVSLREFIHSLVDDVSPEIVNPEALKVIKYWMLSTLGASDPVAYAAKNKETPNVDAMRKQLEATLAMTGKFHRFLKSYLDSDVWSPVARERLLKEFKASCVEELTVIVDNTWME